MKEISKTTGLSFDQIQDLEKDRKELLKKIRTLEEDHTRSKQTTQQYESTIMKLKSLLLECDQTIQTLQENAKLHSEEKESLLSVANEKLQDLTVELQQSNEKIKELENTTLHSHSPADQEHTWGNDSWGTQSEWGKTIDKENEHLW